MTLSERRLRQSMEKRGYDSSEIEDVVDKWADKTVQEEIDADVLERAEAKEAKLRKLDHTRGGIQAVGDYRKADGIILPTPDGTLAFELHTPTQNRLAELALAVRWAINKGLIDLSSLDQRWQDIREVFAQPALGASYD